MKNLKALFIDCDGVLYNKDECTYEDMAVVGFGKTLEFYHISPQEALRKRHRLKAEHIHGLMNAILKLCEDHHIPFDEFAKKMVENTDYSRIRPNTEMLQLLSRVGSQVSVYIVTNNSTPHLHKVLTCLNGGQATTELDLHIHKICIENTLTDGFFQPKQTEMQLTRLCAQIKEKPENVLLLDDTAEICDLAQTQGLQVRQIQNVQETQMILQGVINEKSRIKRNLPVRKTCGRAGG